MVRWLLVKWLVLAVALGITVWLFPGIDVDGSVATYLGIALVLGLVNAVLGPIVKFFTLPLVLLTLGLFALVINALLFLLTAWLLDRFDVDGFLAALGGSLVMSVLVVVLELVVSPLASRRGRSRAGAPAGMTGPITS